MLSVCLLPVGEQQEWSDLARQLIDNGRATRIGWAMDSTGETQQAFVAAERLALVRVAPQAVANPELHLPDGLIGVTASEEATRRIIHGWIEALGPTTAGQCLGDWVSRQQKSKPHCWPWSPTASSCAENLPLLGERKLNGVTDVLSRIHRLTLGRMRKEIEPVSAADFINSFCLATRGGQDPTARARRRFGSPSASCRESSCRRRHGAARVAFADQGLRSFGSRRSLPCRSA